MIFSRATEDFTGENFVVETCFKAPITCGVVDQHRRFNSVSGLYRDVSENMGMPDNFIKKQSETAPDMPPSTFSHMELSLKMG